MIKSFLPYGLVHWYSRDKLKRWVRNIVPFGIVQTYKNSANKKMFTSEYLKNNYVSDLTSNEKWTILAYLKLLENKNKFVKYLEIGIYAGGTIKFLKANTENVHFTGIDLFEDFSPSDDNTHIWKNYSINTVWDALGKDRVVLYKGNSSDVLNKLNERFDFIFIDGNHTYEATKNDFKHSLPLLKHNGFVAFHNCSPGFSNEDRSYIQSDGGPWLLTQELRADKQFFLEQESDRLRIFKYINYGS